MKRALAGLALVALATAGLSGCVFDAEERGGVGIVDEYTDATFYELPANLPPGQPGELIRAKEILSAPLGSRAWRVIYHSRDLAGADIPVSGIVVVPDLPAPADGRTVVSWAHPTTGAAQQCAPSLGLDPFLGMEGLDHLLALGYAVAATDYPGMGVAGPSSYLIGVTEGNSVLDAVRAARNLPGLKLSAKVLLWGHSQGGQAALFAAQQARDYAPELSLEAVAVAAPAADLTVLMSDDIINLSGVTIASYAFPAMEAAYADRYSQEQLQAILTPAGIEATPKMAALCLLTQNGAIHAIADPLIGKYVTADPSTTPPWQTILTENSAGASPIDVPIYIGQGLADVLVIPTATAEYAADLCTRGEKVQFDQFHDVSHALAAYASLPFVLDFFAAAQRGAAPTNCP